MLQVLSLEFNDHSGDWQPDNPTDFDEWVTVNIGEHNSGCRYQIHLCTSSSINRLQKRRYAFCLEEWQSREDTMDKLNMAIAEKLDRHLDDDPYQCLSKSWLWQEAENLQ